MKIHYVRPKLTGYQTKIIDSKARYTVTEASTKAGKTASHIVWLLEQALRGKAFQNFWWVAPIRSQAKIAFDRMQNQLNVPNFFKSNISALTLTLPNKAIIHFKSADNPDSLYGEDVYACVFDEFTRAKELAWIAIRSTVTKTHGKVKFIGNCKGRKGWYAKLALRARAYMAQMQLDGFDNPTPDFEYFRITAYDAVDAGILTIEEVEEAKRSLPEHVFNELFLAIPSDDGGNPFGLQYIDACEVGTISDKPAMCYGIDLAKSVDYTVIIGLDEDGTVCYFERFNKISWAAQMERLTAIDLTKNIYIDSTGVGDPITEALQTAAMRLNYETVHSFKFSASSKQQLMLGLAYALQNKEIYYPTGLIKDELEAYEYVFSNTGVKYAAADGFHDDCVCALALAVKMYKEIKNGAHSSPFGGLFFSPM